MSLNWSKKPPVVQLVDVAAVEEFFGYTNVYLSDAKKLEASERKTALLMGENPPIYVGVVSITRHYGGPEEGGWYYDWYQVEDILMCIGYRHLLAMTRQLRLDWPTCPRGRGSVIGGADTAVYVSRNKKLITDIQSEERPRYE